MPNRKKDNRSNLANKTNKQQESGQPGGGQGRKDELGHSGVYPFSSPRAPSSAEVRNAGTWGQGERGAAGYEDHGGSQLTYQGGQLLGALEERGDSLAAHSQSGSVEIPPEEWIAFFNGFSRQHEGWLTSITVAQGNEPKTEVRECRLEGISSDHLTARDEIYLSIERDDGGHLTHPIRNPMKVIFRGDLEGAHEGVDITSADGTLTRIRFRIAARPETLDGVLADTQHDNAHRPPAETARRQNRTNTSEKRTTEVHDIAVHIPIDHTMLEGNLAVPESARGTVLFAHGSGSSRRSPRNRFVAHVLQNAGFATLLMDLLTAQEEALDERTAALRFDIDLLARRLIGATWWLLDQSQTAKLPVGYFGASTGAAAALVAATDDAGLVSAVVSRGGRPDLAGDALHKVIAPTLLIVGGEDTQVIDLNRRAFSLIPAEKKLEIVPGASHLFEEPGTIEFVAKFAKNWFDIYLSGAAESREPA